MHGDRSVVAVVLAAGMSRRYGSPKQLAVVDGETLLERVVHVAMTAGLRRVVVVVPVWLSPPGGVARLGIEVVRNPFPERGMSLSLRLGLGATAAQTSAALILLGDQPEILPGTIAAILAARGTRPIVAAIADGVPAPPVLLERTHFHLADGLTGDVGLRELLRAHPELVTSVPVAAHPPDIDLPDDLRRIDGP